MSAPKGNQFAKGNKGGRRKGYEYEKKQLEKMRRLLNSFLKLAEELYRKNIISEKELNTLDRKIKIGLHLMDKLHADKKEHDIKGEARVILEGIDDF